MSEEKYLPFDLEIAKRETHRVVVLPRNPCYGEPRQFEVKDIAEFFTLGEIAVLMHSGIVLTFDRYGEALNYKLRLKPRPKKAVTLWVSVYRDGCDYTGYRFGPPKPTLEIARQQAPNATAICPIEFFEEVL